MSNYSSSSQPWYSIRNSIKTVIIGEGVTSIGRYAFQSMGITSVSLPQTLTSIGEWCFSYTNIASIVFPSSLTSIGEYCFYSNGSLSNITMEGTTPPSLGGYAFSGTPSNTKIKVPCGYADAYRNASGWSGLYAAIEEDCSGVEIPEYSISVTSNDESKGNVSGGGTFKEGGLTIISATPKDGYIFDKWNDEEISNPRIVTVSQDSSFVAFFKPLEYSVNISVYPENAGLVTNPTSAHYNENIAISASANEGHKFLQWSDGNKAAQREIVVDGNIKLTALFAVVETDTIRDTITVEIKDTLQTLYVESSNPAQGATCIQIVAIPETGYEFLCWSDFNTENPRTVVLDEKNLQNYTAYFKTSQNIPTSVSAPTSNEELQKLVRNGNVYILTGDKTYTITGQEVK